MNITKNILKENFKRFAVMMLAVFLAIIPLASVNVFAQSVNVTTLPLGYTYAYNNGVMNNNKTSSAVVFFDVSGLGIESGSTVTVSGNVVSSSSTAYRFVFGTSYVSGTMSTQLLQTTIANTYAMNVTFTYNGDTYIWFRGIDTNVNYDLTNVTISYDGVSSEPIYSEYDIENGYLSVIDLGESGADYEVILRTEMPMLSEWITGKFRYSNQTYWFADSWPTTETTIPNSGATLIEWERYGNRNYMGQTKNANATLSGTSSGRYMYIYNPAGQPNPSIISVYQANMSMMENNTVHVTVEGSGLNIRVYNSQGSYSASVGGVSGSIVADDDYGQATTTTSGGAMQMIVSGGGIYTQTSGGANDVGIVQSVQNYLDGIQSTLTQFMNNVVSLLTTPIEYISSLIQQGGTFVTNIGQFWNWLPSPLPQYLITAILVVISIGIFHTFL